MVQGTTASVVVGQDRAGSAAAASAAPTLAELEAFARAEAIRHLLPRFGSEEAVRRFSQVYSVGSCLVVSAGIEEEAIALAEHVRGALRARFGVEARYRQNPYPGLYGKSHHVFYSPESMACRRFAVQFDVAPLA